MKSYQDLQKLYLLPEITEHCVDLDFAYAFICAMAGSELELQQWMPLLFRQGETTFSDEKVATDFAQTVLAVYQQALEQFQGNIPLSLVTESDATATTVITEATISFASGYLQALMMLDNMQIVTFPEGSALSNLQQTCLLLLDKMATVDTQDPQKLALFAQLPSHNEIVSLLPSLLSNYGHLCLLNES